MGCRRAITRQLFSPACGALIMGIYSRYSPLRLVLALALTAAFSSGRAADPASLGRERTRLDAGWRFALGDASDPAKDFGHGTGFFSYLAKTGFGDGPAAPGFDDRTWRIVDVPHDWAVEMPFDPRASHSHGYKAVGPRFPETSVGWYRRTFTVANEDLGRRIRLELDGAYRDARVFVNGFFVGEEPSGYLPASYDITDYVNYGGENVVAVRVDASMEEGWFYEGAGLYRHVWLLKTAPLHVARFGTFVQTTIAGANATVSIETTTTNEGREAADYSIEQTLLAPDGNLVARRESRAGLLAGGSDTRRDEFTVTAPQLWSLEHPTLYRMVTRLRQNGAIVDTYETPFGIRTLRFDPDAGFFLNGKHVVLKGTNNHQDHAGIGVALPDAMQELRIRRLKEMGSNAYRCSHNPPTPELLDACDRLGMLVIDENRLMGSNPWHLRQLSDMIRRDRNHPSVILWSLGNEEWGIESNIHGARITTTMQDFARRLDPTRLTTVAISGGWGGTSSVVDVAGVNYVRQAKVDEQHAKYPKQIIVGTEETTTQGTRGVYFDDRPHQHLGPQADGSSGGNAEFGWQYYVARPFAAGLFFWTGFDYRGEPTPFGYPAISSQFGILDTCGFPKDCFYYLQSWWSDAPVLHVSPHWNWPDRLGQEIEVEVYGNGDEVELALNGASLGRKPMPRNGHLSWRVKYEPGTLAARAFTGGRETLVTKVETTGGPARVALVPDRKQISADGQDVSVVEVAIQDAAGRVVPTAGNRATFAVSGPGRIIGVGNGDPSCLEPDKYVETVRAMPLEKMTKPDVAASTYTVAGEFDGATLHPGDAVELVLLSLGTQQSVWLNDQVIYRDADPARARTIVRLNASNVHPGRNVLRIEGTAFAQPWDRERTRDTAPALLRIATPAKPWMRSAFNGLAQIIVQSTGEPGTITLTAESEGLATGTVDIHAEK